MSKRPDLKTLHVLHYPNPALREVSKQIAEINSFLGEMSARMAEVMQEEKGVGLAAPQVGWPFRLTVINPTLEPGKCETYINPVIIHREGKMVGDEGCLSVPGVFAKVRRAEKVRVRATLLRGETVEFDAEGLAARMWQHEMDHFEGALFLDRIGPAAKILLRRSLRDLEARYVPEPDDQADDGQ